MNSEELNRKGGAIEYGSIQLLGMMVMQYFCQSKISKIPRALKKLGLLNCHAYQKIAFIYELKCDTTKISSLYFMQEIEIIIIRSQKNDNRYLNHVMSVIATTICFSDKITFLNSEI